MAKRADGKSQEYIWIEGHQRKDGTQVKGHFRAVIEGTVGTHRAIRGYQTKAGKKVRGYIQRKGEQTPHVSRPHIRTTKGGKKQFVRGHARGGAKITEDVIKKHGNNPNLWSGGAATHSQGSTKTGRKTPPPNPAPKQRIIKHEWDLAAALEDEGDIHVQQGMSSAFEAGMRILEIASQTIPIDTGFMMEQGYVDQENDAIRIGYDTHYAIYVHEDLGMRHDPGQRAKWLELTIMENPDLYMGTILSGLRRLYGPAEFTPEGAIHDSTPFGKPPYKQYGPKNPYGGSNKK